MKPFEITSVPDEFKYPDAGAAGFLIRDHFACQRSTITPLGEICPELLDAGAAALNQNNEYDDEENAGNNADQESAVHLKTPFMGTTLKIILSQPAGGFESPGSQKGG
jgi:hypothetical protein